MSLYRAPPPVLPSLADVGEEPTATMALIRSLRILIDPQCLTAANQRERDARAAAGAVPCPAFASGPDLRGPRSPRPPQDLVA